MRESAYRNALSRGGCELQRIRFSGKGVGKADVHVVHQTEIVVAVLGGQS